MLASWIAARSVQRPVDVAQTPLPTLASTTSAVLSTVKLAARTAAGTIAASAQIATSTNRPRVIALLAGMDQPLIADFRRRPTPSALRGRRSRITGPNCWRYSTEGDGAPTTGHSAHLAFKSLNAQGPAPP
jgi:hypothetical protein